MAKVIIGVDPHKLSATIEVVDRHEKLLGSGRFRTDQAGYTAMRAYARNWPERVWAVEGSNGAGRPLAQRLLEAGEHVVDVPAKLAARVRLFDTGHNRKTDARDAHSIAIVAVRTTTLRVLRADGELEALRMLCDRREEFTRLRVQTVNRLQRLLAELVPGQAKKDLTALQAKAILATVRPRDIAGKTRRRIAAEELADLVAVEAKMKKATAELKVLVKARGSRLMELHGVGPVVAARTLADVGDIARFADRNRFASWTGTAPLDASSGEQNRHRLSRAGNRRMNHMIHIAAISQIRLDTPGRAYYRRKLAAGKTKLEALRCLKRRISDALYRQLLADVEQGQHLSTAEPVGTGPGGHCGASQESARSTCPRTSTLRISHFPDPRNRRYNWQRPPGRPPGQRSPRPPVDNKGEPEGRIRAGPRTTRAGRSTDVLVDDEIGATRAVAECDPCVVTHDFYSDRTSGPTPRVADELSAPMWNGLAALIYSRLDGQWLAHSFPIECADGNGIVDTNREAFINLLLALVPDAPWPLTGNGVPDAPVVFDVVEFVANRVAKPERGHWHDFLRHHELTFDSRVGGRAFRHEVNQLLARNGIAYEMNQELQFVRMGPPEGRSIITDLRPQTGDSTLDHLIIASRVRFLSRYPDDRPIALQNIWDAFERIKTIEPGPGKQTSMPALLDKVAAGRMRDYLEQEARALSSIGNNTQIRHFEIDKPALSAAEIDYLYVRMTGFLVHVLRSLDMLEG